jgi:hypothetical protein
MDLVIDMFAQETAETESRLTEAVKRLVADARPELAARVASSDSSAYLDPLLLAYFQATQDPGVTLDQLLVGHIDPRVRPSGSRIRTDVHGAAEIPGIGILRTNHRAAELSLDDQLAVTSEGDLVSAQLEPQPRVRFEHEPVFDPWVAPPLQFIVHGASAVGSGSSAGRVTADLRRAVEILERVQPQFARLMNRTTRRVVVFDHAGLNSLAAPRAHGSVFLNLAHGSGPIYHLEDLLHQCGHVAFQAMTMYPESVLSVPPDQPLGEPDDSGEARTAYVVLHAVVTERWMVRGLLSCLATEDLSDLERIEARGRLAYTLRRYVLDLTDLVDAHVASPRGTTLLRQLLADLRTLHGLAQPFTRGLDLSDQPYNFNLDTFVERNPALFVSDQP